MKVNQDTMGCDLRLVNPEKIDPASISCCGAETATADLTARANGPAAGGSYHQPQDLGRFGEIRRANPQMAESFLAYYGQVMANGELTKPVRALIALAVSHALKCPYCIDSYTTTLHKMHVSEAVHVASAMAAGIALVAQRANVEQARSACSPARERREP